MSEKYYTPSIEELRIGMEVELLHSTDGWIKYTNPKLIPLGSRSLEEGIRVKYLDREDIESEAFKYDEKFKDFSESKSINVYSKTLKYRGDDATLMLIHNTVSNWVCISWSNPAGAAYHSEKKYDEASIPLVEINITNTIFAGHTKNKSELKVLLKQLGI